MLKVKSPIRKIAQNVVCFLVSNPGSSVLIFS